MSSAQSLPEFNRITIEKEMKSNVYDKYGSREFSGIAYECSEHNGHHIVAENYIVEILKDGKPALPGEIGEVIITDLNNKCMPFIRYRIGDLAIAVEQKTCNCGRSLPLIGDIEGRVQSIILCENGTYLPGTFFSHFFKDYDYMIKQYQVIQNDKGKITLTIIKAPRFDTRNFETCLTLLKTYLGINTIISLNFVDTIPLIKTGKHQSVISTLKIDFQKTQEQNINSKAS
jgi:phenylacetate-CoA ligase